MRYERKYRIESNTFEQVRDSLTLNPAGFSVRYEDRWVNSIYLDTVDYNALKENIDGISDRVKYRVRWYGEDLFDARKPLLEHKIKHNMVGRKNHEKVASFKLNEFSESADLNKYFNRYNVQPVVVVRYLRSYYESFDNRVRATVDRCLIYYPISLNRLEDNPVQDDAVILEIKYDQSIESEIDHCLQAVPYRLTKNSKFVHAMSSFWM